MTTSHADIHNLKNFDPECLTDRQLYDVCQRIGAFALKARRKFVGLLPLVERRRAYQGRGLYSIYDFAAKLGGVGREVVNEVLRVDSYLCAAPTLRKKLYRGEIGWTKMRVVAHFLTPRNEKEWMEKLETLSKSALEIYVRGYRAQKMQDATLSLLEADIAVRPGQTSMTTRIISEQNERIDNNENILHDNIQNRKIIINEAHFLPGERTELQNIYKIEQQNSQGAQNKNERDHIFADLAQQRETITFSMKRDIASRLRLFRRELEKERKTLITWEEVMEEFLKRTEHDQEHDQKDHKKSDTIRDAKKNDTEKVTTRHIPNAVRREVTQRYGDLCAFPNCGRPAEILHHTWRFALTKHLARKEAHDPNHIKPLCKAHERIAHTTLIADENEDDTRTWRLLETPDTASEKYKIDQQVNAYRKPKE